MSWLIARSRLNGGFVRVVDLSRVAALEVLEGKTKALISLKSNTDITLGQIEIEKECKDKALAFLTMLIEQSKQHSDARIFTIKDSGIEEFRFEAKPQEVKT